MDFDLQFGSGEISAIRSGVIAVNELHSYRFTANAGQIISVGVVSKEDNASFDLLYQVENGDWVTVDSNNGIASEKRVWSSVLPASHNGTYLIELANYFSDTEAEYDLFVGISIISIDDDYVERLVTKNSADTVSLGMSLPELMSNVSDKTLVLGSDGEGVISLEVLTGSKFLMALYMDTDCIGHESKVKVIEAWGREFVTAEGAFPTMPLDEAIDIYGGLENIQFSEIEAREFATFKNHPEGILFEVYGGDFRDNQNITTEILADAQITALWIKA